MGPSHDVCSKEVSIWYICFIEKKIEKKISWLPGALVGALENDTFLHEQGAVIMGPKYR